MSSKDIIKELVHEEEVTVEKQGAKQVVTGVLVLIKLVSDNPEGVRDNFISVNVRMELPLAYLKSSKGVNYCRIGDIIDYNKEQMVDY